MRVSQKYTIYRLVQNGKSSSNSQNVTCRKGVTGRNTVTRFV
jgi:hypothetical protein